MDSIKTGQLIAELRKKKGINQIELAQLLNISNRTVSKWENGDGFPDISLLPDLAFVLGISTDELLAGELVGVEEEDTYPTFEFVGKDSLKSHIAIQKHSYRTRAPLWYQIIITVCFALVFIFLSGMTLNAFNDTLFDNTPLIAMILLLLSLFGYFAPYICGLLSYINSRAFNGNKSLDSKMVVSDKLYFDNGSKHLEYDFGDVTGFYITKKHYIIKLHKRVYTASNKSELITGNNEEFESYINSMITPKKESKARLILCIVLCVVLVFETTILGALFFYTADFDHMVDDNLYSLEDIVKFDDAELCSAMYERIWEKIDYDEKSNSYVFDNLNQKELNFYYVYNFYTELIECDMLSYIYGNNNEMPYLSSSLCVVGLDEVSNEYNKFIEENKIDIIKLSKENLNEYEDLIDKYNCKDINEYMENVDIQNKLNKALADYVKANQSSFE